MTRMSDTNDYIMIFSTCPGSITAKQIAQDLVANSRAACVNVIPGVHSYFKWGNKVDVKEEYLLVIKTRAELFEQVKKDILSLHPYELPEIIAVPIQNGSKEYLAWINENVG